MSLFYYFILGAWMFSPDVCLCTTCMPGACEDQKRVPDPLELELQMFVSTLWVLEIET